jgi:hypothetical protein
VTLVPWTPADYAEPALALLAFLTVVGGIVDWRARSLRSEDVLQWAHECINCLETLVLLCEVNLQATEDPTRVDTVIFSTATLAERGRLFFRNQPKRRPTISDVVLRRWPGPPQLEKEPAYRGWRPVILDQLIVAHQIASRLPSTPPDERWKLKVLALQALKRFVSLAQQEVGRSRTASDDPGQAGRHIDLRAMILAVEVAADDERAQRRADRESAASVRPAGP